MSGYYVMPLGDIEALDEAEKDRLIERKCRSLMAWVKRETGEHPNWTEVLREIDIDDSTDHLVIITKIVAHMGERQIEP